jgi:hypothetical protein
VGSSGRAEQLRLAASAAEARAMECRDRLDGLRGEPTTSTEDVRRARERLATAASRAQAAEQRLAELQALRTTRKVRGRPHVDDGACALPERLTDDGASSFAGRLLESVRKGRCNGNDLWLEFATYGGSCDFWEFDAYLNGLWVMPLPARRVLEQVWWEWERDAGS